jgi:hypothetical protein
MDVSVCPSVMYFIPISVIYDNPPYSGCEPHIGREQYGGRE